MSQAGLVERLRLYLVADPDQACGDLMVVVEAALRGGVTAVQLRSKHAADRELLRQATAMRALCRAHDALFLMNDRVDIALAAEADGVHLGVDDLPLEAARQFSGSDFIIGYSPETDEQASSARQRGADYLGVGPVYGTASKSDAGPAIGLSVVQRRAALANVPVIGIGGVSASNAKPVLEHGAIGVAVVGAILRAGDPEQAARALNSVLTS